MQLSVDLNCDLGEIDESPGLDRDSLMLNYVSSINIACGYHAGDPDRMRRLVRLAIPKQIAIGAHPSYPDRVHFGRREMSLSESQIREIVLDQVRILSKIVKEEGGMLRHVKPHGALYNQAAVREDLATWIVEAIASVDSHLAVMGLSGSYLIAAAKRIGLTTISEVFSDRQYTSEGTLVPRDRPNAMIHGEQDAVERVLKMIRNKEVVSVEGRSIPIQADTVCIHSDTPNAAAIAAQLRMGLEKNGVDIRAHAIVMPST